MFGLIIVGYTPTNVRVSNNKINNSTNRSNVLKYRIIRFMLFKPGYYVSKTH